MGRFAGAVVSLVLFLSTGACNNDSPSSKSARRTSAPTIDPAYSLECDKRPEGNSPARFDAGSGTYAAQSLAVVAGGRVQFDIVQWLSGKDADDAYERESNDDSGAPNDYYLLNESQELRTASVAADTAIRVLNVDAGEFRLQRAALPDVDGAEASDVFWLSFADGAITEICQQYRP